MRKLVLAVAVCIAACGDNGDDDDNSGGEEQACLDIADAVADAAVRCGSGTYQANYDGFIDAAACGDCGNIIYLRDRGDVYAECIPSLETISCDDFAAVNLDSSCTDQLLRQYPDCASY